MKRVFVFSRRSLFSQGVKNLLDAEPGLTVVGWESDPVEAIKRIEETRPDTVLHIIEGKSALSTSTSENLLKLGVKARIVELSLEDSNVCVYQGEQLIVTEIGDLVSVI